MPSLPASPYFTSALVSTTAEASALCLMKAKSLEKAAEEQLFSLCMMEKPSHCSSAKAQTKEAHQVPALALETGCLSLMWDRQSPAVHTASSHSFASPGLDGCLLPKRGNKNRTFCPSSQHRSDINTKRMSKEISSEKEAIFNVGRALSRLTASEQTYYFPFLTNKTQGQR